MERMTVGVEWKASGADDGTLEGYASTFGNVDLGMDVIEKGAFTDTIRHIKSEGIPLLADHDASTGSVLGTIYDAREDAHGLLIKARFSSAPSAQDVRTKLVEGHLTKMSIGYEPQKFAFEDRDGQTIRLLQKIALWETSVVVFPMNPQATIERVKSLAGTLDTDGRKALAAAVLDDDTDSPEAPEGDGDAEARHAEAEGTDGDAPAGEADPEPSWDHYASEAVLAGEDPEALADPAQRAGMEQRLALLEESLAALDAPVNETVRAGLAESLRLMEDDISEAQTAVPAGERGDLEQGLARLEESPESV